MYTNTGIRSPFYSVEVFEDVGRASCIALLDYIDKNPISRIPMSAAKTLEGLKYEICTQYNLLFVKKPIKKEAQRQALNSSVAKNNYQRSNSLPKQ